MKYLRLLLVTALMITYLRGETWWEKYEPFVDPPPRVDYRHPNNQGHSMGWLPAGFEYDGGSWMFRK